MTVDRARSTYRFRHALFAEAVLDQFLPGERAAVHGIIAAVLAQRPELSTGPSELGYHRAAAGDLQAALVPYSAAAEEAERVYAFGEAGQYLERVLELWARVPEAAERAGRSRGNVFGGRRGARRPCRGLRSRCRIRYRCHRRTGHRRRPAAAWRRVMAANRDVPPAGRQWPAGVSSYQAAATLLDSAPQARGRSRLAAEHALALGIWGKNDEAVTQAERALRLAADRG